MFLSESCPSLVYHKRWLSQCRKKLYGADDDEGYQTGVGTGQEQEQGRSRAGEGVGP